MGTIVAVSLDKSCASVNLEQSSLKYSHASFTWEQSYHSDLGAVVAASLGNKCVSFIWEQSSQLHLRTIVSVSLGNTLTFVTGNNYASVT